MLPKTDYKKIAITGATGFLGKYLVKHYISCGYDVLVLAREEEHPETCYDYPVNYVMTDYSVASLEAVLKDREVVVHLVGQTLQRDSNPLMISQFFKVNVGILENIVIAGRQTGLKAVYQMSSNNVYSSANTMPWDESQIPVPSSVYGLSKQMAEALGAYISSVTDIKVVSLRLARLFGYGERDTVVFTKYMKLAIKKQQLEVWGTGSTSIEYLYVRDVVDAIETAVRTDIPAGAYNVGCGKSFSVLEIAETINREAGNDGNLFIDSTKPEGNYHILMDSSKFTKATNWEPKWTLGEAVKEMISLYQNE